MGGGSCVGRGGDSSITFSLTELVGGIFAWLDFVCAKISSTGGNFLGEGIYAGTRYPQGRRVARVSLNYRQPARWDASSCHSGTFTHTARRTQRSTLNMY